MDTFFSLMMLFSFFFYAYPKVVLNRHFLQPSWEKDKTPQKKTKRHPDQQPYAKTLYLTLSQCRQTAFKHQIPPFEDEFRKKKKNLGRAAESREHTQP